MSTSIAYLRVGESWMYSDMSPEELAFFRQAETFVHSLQFDPHMDKQRAENIARATYYLDNELPNIETRVMHHLVFRHIITFVENADDRKYEYTKKVLGKGFDINYKNSGHNLLYNVQKLNDVEFAQFLLDNGAMPSKGSSDESSD